MINSNWKFYKGSVESGFSAKLDDSNWETVKLGHTWNNIDGQDGKPNNKDINDTDYYRGDGWYRKHLTFDENDKDKLIFLRFQGSNTITSVYVNEQLAGAHSGGYTAFCFDITPFIKIGTDNLIAVKVNNERCEAIAPLTADFTFYGGIYREIELIKKEKIHFSFGEFATRGLKLSTPQVSKEKATCVFETEIANNTNQTKAIQINGILSSPKSFIDNAYISHIDFDKKELISGNEVYTQQTEAEIAAGETKRITLTFEIPSPKLWNGRKCPYLYDAQVQLICDGNIIDSVSDNIGFRYYKADKDKGFFLNGESYPLRGVSRHQDREGLGNALTNKEHDEDFALIYEMGVNAIRLAHYPQAEYFYKMCDRYGIVVWAEIPFVDLVGGNGEYNHPNSDRIAFFCTTKNQLQELIHQNYNHPAIVCWGLQNEVKAKFDSVMRPFMEELYKTGKEADPYRLLTQATNQKTAYNWKSDLINWNVYPGWYGMSRKSLGRFMDRNRCDRPLGISEYGAGGNEFQHEEKPRKPKFNGQWHPEEYQTLCHEAFLKDINKRPYLWATFVWNMFDFGSDGRNEGSRPGRNDKGLVSFDRKIKKDSYYLYQSNWSIHPMIHIAEARNTKRKKRKTDIRVYSNCQSVTLNLNDSEIKTIHANECKQKGVFIFKNIRLQKGKNEVTATAVINKTSIVCTANFEY
ncbi:MAG: hypothetical protein K2H13_09520 [Eubacterium sp.]|nr:hypothetical protein [Eubacterium sp.]